MLFVTIQGAAQDAPDFSGNWILVSPVEPPPHVPRSMTVQTSYTRESARGTPIDPPLVTVTIARTFADEVRSERLTVGTTGGSVGGLAADAFADGTPSVAQTGTSTRFDGSKLVIDVSSSGSPGAADSYRREAWTLDEQDTLSIAIIERGASSESTTTLVYRRRQGAFE
jgi:hypothetical protein